MKPIVVRLVALIALASVTAQGRAVAESRFTSSASLVFPPVPADSSLIYLVREQLVRFNRLPPEHLYLDDAPLGLLPQKSYLALTIAAGRHCLWGVVDGPEFWFESRAGRSYLLRFREFIDADDRLVQSWLLDDVQTVRGLVNRRRPAFAQTTGAGMTFLRKRLVDHPREPSHDGPHGSMADLPIVCEHAWAEDPLDKVNLKRDLENITGRLTVDASGVRFAARRDSVAIRFDQITRVRYGGLRFTGINPWIDVIFDTPKGPRVWSFADSRAVVHAVDTYNRVFAAIEDRRPVPWQAGPWDTAGAVPGDDPAAPDRSAAPDRRPR